MPIDMQRAPKIPVGRGPSNLERVEIEVVDDGSYIVTCYHKPDKAAVAGGAGGALAIMGGGEAKRYTFQNADMAQAFVGDKLHGRATVAKGESVGDEGAAEPALPRKRPPTAEPDDTAMPEEEAPPADEGDEY